MSKKYWWLGGIIIIILAVLVVGKAVFHSAPSSIAAEPTVRIAYLPVAQALPLYVALERGYFKQAGINVAPISFNDPSQIINAVLSGQVDFGAPSTASGITAVSDSKKPGSLQIFALQGSDKQNPSDAILVRADSAMQSIQDLRGKKIATLPGIQWQTIATHILAQNNLSIGRDVTLVPLALPLQGPALKSGQVDALLTIEPAVTVNVHSGDARILAEEPALADIANPFYPAVGVVNSSFAAAHPELAQKIIAILGRATSDIEQNPSSTRPYLVKYASLTPTLADIVPLPIFRMYDNWSASDLSALQKFFDLFYAYKVIDQPVSAAALLWHAPSSSYAVSNSHQ